MAIKHIITLVKTFTRFNKPHKTSLPHNDLFYSFLGQKILNLGYSRYVHMHIFDNGPIGVHALPLVADQEIMILYWQ